jgi:hypothetical protein
MKEDTHKDVATPEDKAFLRAMNEHVAKKARRLMLKKQMCRAAQPLSDDPSSF